MFQHPGSRQAFPPVNDFLGMTMREYMVAAALTGLASNYLGRDWSADDIAREAVRLADATLRKLQPNADREHA